MSSWLDCSGLYHKRRVPLRRRCHDLSQTIFSRKDYRLVNGATRYGGSLCEMLGRESVTWSERDQSLGFGSKPRDSTVPMFSKSPWLNGVHLCAEKSQISSWQPSHGKAPNENLRFPCRVSCTPPRPRGKPMPRLGTISGSQILSDLTLTSIRIGLLW